LIDSKNIDSIAYNYLTKSMEIKLFDEILHNKRNTKLIVLKTSESYFIEFSQEWLNTKKV
jgi:hypothetical protein